jgi:two-component system phosphate regulon sensor histidine kinase PhoR
MAILVGVALVGLISVQIYWARKTFKEAETVFNDKVSAILSDVCKEATDFSTCFTLYSKAYINPQEGIYMLKSQWEKKNEETWLKSGKTDSLPMFFNVPEEYKNSPLNKVYYDLKFSKPVTAEILLKFRYDLDGTSPDKEVLSQKPSTENFKELIRNHEEVLTIYDTLMIDSLIQLQLKNNNIPAEFHYAILNTGNDSIEYSSMPILTSEILKSGNRERLTPADLFSTPYDIFLFVKNKNQLILKSVTTVLAVSIGIILILLFAYLYFIRTILKQKKLSEMKDDFINNITHELNTPITNISLAFETLRSNNKINNDGYAEKISRIIQTETDNLKESVSRILRISSYEKNGIDLSREKLELGSLITTSLERFELKLNQKKAVINKQFPDHPVYYMGDRLHLSNSIENLIDNAIKYSNGKCHIDLSLAVEKGKTIFCIKDSGIGMSKQELGKIFEKFYRVQHGNIQNERGFGLGLNYVKKIIEKHGGEISVNSEQGKGTCFTIVLSKDEQKG